MTEPASIPRSLTQMLREFGDRDIAELLVARPDLADPTPESFSQIASRATTRESVRIALAGLDAVTLWVAHAVCAATDTRLTSDTGDLGAEQIDASMDTLRRRALAWGPPGRLRPVRALVAELGTELPGVVPAPAPPAWPGGDVQDPLRVDIVAAGSAFELIRRMEVLVEHADHAPLLLRGDGALAQREGRALAALLDLPTAVAAFHAQLALVSGLVAVMPQGRSDVLVPTTAVDEWQRESLAEQWMLLALSWRENHPLSGDRGLKQLCWQAFGDPDDGRVVEIGWLRQWLRWYLPRRADDAGRRAATLLTQAAWMGFTGLGALAGFAPTGSEIEDAEARLHRLLPERAETVLVQNDLTAIAPAPLTAQASRDLGAIADVESRGGATVYRFTPQSLRRAHQAGWSSYDITARLTALSTVPLPQPLRYLIDDLERAPHGQPAATAKTTGRTARTTAGVPVPRIPAPLVLPVMDPAADALAAAAESVAALRAAAEHEAESSMESMPDSASGAESEPGAGPEELGRPGAHVPLDTLREAVETAEQTWIGFVDRLGAELEAVVVVLSIEDGIVVSTDRKTQQELRVPLSRIRSAHILRGHSL